MKTFAALLLVCLLLLSVAASAYAECFLPSHHRLFATDHETSTIHCPNGYLGSATRVSSLVRPYRSDIGSTLENRGSETHANVAAGHFRENTFEKPFYQRSFYQFEEVYRL